MEILLRDLRHAVRSAAGAPGFTALAALTLALGIGAATVVFALVDAVLLRPFPFDRPDRLVAIWGESPDAASRRASRLRRLLVVSEISLALVLLVGAGLMARSFARLRSTDPGFDPRGVLTFRISLDDARQSTPEAQAAWFRAAVERLEEVPGVESAAAVLLRPLAASIGWEYHFTVEGQTDAEQIRNPISNHERVSPGYFATMGIPILEGRDFTWEDGPDAPRVGIVSRAMAERFWPRGDALGKRLHWASPDADWPWLTIVGVAGDARYLNLDEPRFDVYVPFQQEPHWSMDFVLRSGERSRDLVPRVRAALAELDPTRPFVPLVLLAAGLAAILSPALHATEVEPRTALRGD